MIKLQLFIFSILIITCLSATASPWQLQVIPFEDKDFGCVTPSQAEKYISDLGIDIEKFGGTELCDNTKHSKKLFNTIWAIESGKFSNSSEDNVLLPEIIGKDAYTYLTNRIRKVESGTSDQFAAYVYEGETTMYIVGDIFFNGSIINRASLFLHEARHIDGPGYAHVTCLSGARAGSEGGCDPSISYQGSYDVSAEYFTRVALYGENFHPAYRWMARYNATDAVLNFFNEVPAQETDVLVLSTGDDRHIAIWDGHQLIERQNLIVPDSFWIASQNGEIKVIPLQRTQPSLLLSVYFKNFLKASDFGDNWKYLAGKTIMDYDRQTSVERQSLLDVRNYEGYQARMYIDHVLYSGETEITLDLKDLKPVGFVDPAVCGLKNEPKRFFFRTASLKVFSVREDQDSLKLESTNCNFPENLKEVTQFQDQVLGINHDGQVVLLDIQEGSIREKIFAPLSGRKFHNMIKVRALRELIKADIQP